MSERTLKVVTLGDECLSIEFDRRELDPNRDGHLFLYRVRDLQHQRRERLVQVFKAGQLKVKDETRADVARLNSIRRAFDSDRLKFGGGCDAERYEEVKLSVADLSPGKAVSEQQLRDFMKRSAYWLGWRHSADPGRHWVRFDTEEDLDYLNVERSDVRRHISLMAQQGLLLTTDAPGTGRPTAKLIEEFNPQHAAQNIVDKQQMGDRKFAKMAIEEARKSAAEDNRTHPKVGAVVVKDGHVLGKAHRGELPECHAEFVLLEKKLGDASLVGATLYTTLEPCTTRTHPKVPCVERLIARRVERVVIGMLDPDQRITGRGQRRLRDARVTVDTFPPDLADEVEELNRDFTRSRTAESIVQPKADSEELGRKAYLEDLRVRARQILYNVMTLEGRELLRHLLRNEPIENGRTFIAEIPQGRQQQQLGIAKQYGLVQQKPEHKGMLRIYWAINPHFRPILEEVLYEEN